MLQRITSPFAFSGISGAAYLCEEAGDGIPLHFHQFNHITVPLKGQIEVYDDAGTSVILSPGDQPVNFVARRTHGIRALTDGAMFMNLSPDRRDASCQL